jgi:hypothetical protein
MKAIEDVRGAPLPSDGARLQYEIMERTDECRRKERSVTRGLK